jgi:hypothetical protein
VSTEDSAALPTRSSEDRPEVADARPHALLVELAGGGALLGLFGLLLWSRFAALNQSLWHDEVWTVVNYIDPGPRAVFAHYLPNDHMLFSLLTWATVSLVGRSETAFRAWGAVPGCLAVVLLTLWLRRRDGIGAALAFALLAVTAPLLFDYSREARGYGLAFLANATLLVAAVELSRAPRSDTGGDRRGGPPRWAASVFAVAGAAGIATLPVFVLAFLASAVPLVASSDRWLRRVALHAVLAVGVLCLAFYAPVLRDVAASSSQHFGEQLGWHAALTQPPYDLFRRELEFYGIGGSDWFVGVVFYAFALLGAWRLARRCGATPMLAIALPLPFAYGALAAMRFFVEDRFVSFLVLNALLLVSLGAVEVAAFAARSRLLALVAAVVVAFPIAHGLGTFCGIARNAIALPREDWKAVASLVEGAGDVPVWSNSGRRQALDYYLRRPVRIAGPQDLGRALCDDAAPLVFIDHPIRPIPFDAACLERSGAVRVPIAQRESYGDRSETTTVWIRGGAAAVGGAGEGQPR